MMLQVVPVQSPASLVHLHADSARVAGRVGEVLGLNMIEDCQSAMVGELVADFTLVLAILVGYVGGKGGGQLVCNSRLKVTIINQNLS